jgi:hypothetical protein
MNNKIGRKITSLTLLTILLASGTTFAMPGAIPVAEASHNANLFVSSENSQFNNYFAGPQVIEVVINDNDVRTLDDVHGEPDVTVNGKKLRVAQATDGNWYGYFASKSQAQAADATVTATVANEGLDFGEFCAGTGSTALTPSYSETVGVAVARSNFNGVNGTTSITACTTILGIGSSAKLIHVVRENKTLNSATGSLGQIGVQASSWPTIQLYDFSTGGNVIVKYNKGGGSQTTTLTFDTIPSNLIKTSLDRSTYPRSAQVHTTIADPQLNIDPTDEDSWTWATDSTASQLVYQLFDENGAADATSNDAAANVIGNLTTFMFEKNGILTVNLAAQGVTVAAFGDNDDQVFPNTARTLSQQMTLVESDPKSGIFGNYDESDNANLDIISTAARGKSATIRYNDVSSSVVVGFGFASISMGAPDSEWNSGEEIPVTLVDSDANKNSRSDEDLDVNSPDVALIPALRIGNPFTLSGSNDFALLSGLVTAEVTNVGNVAQPLDSVVTFRTVTAGGAQDDIGGAATTVQAFSDRAILDWSGSGQPVIVNTGSNGESAIAIDLGGHDLGDVRDALVNSGDGSDRGLNLLNFDIRGINATAITSAKFYLLVNASTVADTTFTLVGPSTGSEGFGAGTATNDTSDVVGISLANATSSRGLISMNITSGVTRADSITDLIFNNATMDADDDVGLLILFNQTSNFVINMSKNSPIVADFFSFGITGDGLKTVDRINNAIYRFELEETGDNTSTFIGSAEFTMLNQLNIFDSSIYTGLRSIDDEVTFVVHEDLTDEDAPRISYLDLGQDGVDTQVSVQEDADTHSGVVSFDKDTYKVADTVTVTLQDGDLNVDSDLIDIYVALANGTVSTVTVPFGDPAIDTVGKGAQGRYSNGDPFGRLLDITFDDIAWKSPSTDSPCALDSSLAADTGLADAGFTLIETGISTGVFTGDFQIPSNYCPDEDAAAASTTGLDLEVNYVDFRDGSGETIEVGDGAGIRANTGSVSLDRTVYPVPFGTIANFADPAGDNVTPQSRSIFPVHSTGITDGDLDEAAETIGEGDLTIHVRINDPDFDISAAGEDKIQINSSAGVGPVKITVSRGADKVVLGYAGGPAAKAGFIDVNDADPKEARQFGPITEIAPAAGIFEADISVLYTDGPADSKCPDTKTTGYTGITGVTGGAVLTRFNTAPSSGTDYCIIQGDIITVEYTDPTDSSGDVNTVTDSATFDLRNGVLQSDKSVYIIGSDAILTLIEPDLNLDSDSAESYDLDLIEWDSDAATVTMGDLGGNAANFDPEPSDFRETGDDTGIFQIVVEVPSALDGEQLDRGEEIQLEYTDWGPSGADFVGDEDEDINLTIYTSNFGATVELDQKVYTWTDKVYITIVAPDHNFDSNLIDEIGSSNVNKITVATRGDKLNNYKLVETGVDTGIFTGEVILTGFSSHDADGDGTTGDATQTKSADGGGPTDGFLPADDDDGLTVSFEFTEDETVVGSALIRWNIGEVQFLEASYPATGQGVVRVVDPDMNLNPEAVDTFDIDTWSDSDAGGIDLTVTETNEATGIFEGTVFFTVTDESSGHRLRVAEGDTVTAEYTDNTLPNPYTTADELQISATTFIGSIVPPLERAPASNARIVDAFGNELSEVSVDQQVQITADLANGQDRDQSFAYLVQIQDSDGVTVSLSWITGSLAPGQSLNPAQSWTPTSPGTYNVQIFVWESVDNPDALSPPVSTTITVN